MVLLTKGKIRPVSLGYVELCGAKMSSKNSLSDCSVDHSPEDCFFASCEFYHPQFLRRLVTALY